VAAGIMPVFGEGFDSFTRGLITPLSLKIAPFGEGIAKGVTLQSETSYIFGGITGADLGNTTTRYATGGEWNVSFAVGYDFRRRSADISTVNDNGWTAPAALAAWKVK